MMHMHFWFGTDIGDFFINGFEIKSTKGFVGLCFVLFSLSVFYEGLKVHKAKSKAKTAREQRQRTSSFAPSENATLLSGMSNPNDPHSNLNKPPLRRLLDSAIEMTSFIFTNVLNYFLMLTVMLYNGYLFIAVVLGFTVGYFLFGHMSMKINMENLQAIQTKIVCSSSCRQPDEGHSSASLDSYQHAIPSVSQRITTETALQRLAAPINNEQIENYGSTACH